MARMFDIGDVLSVTTGRLVSARGIEGVYDILGYMTRDNLLTHQLPRAQVACNPVLCAQYPDLPNEANVPELTPEAWQGWLREQRDRFGDTLEVVPLAEWEHRDPVAELVAKKGAENVVVVVVPEPEVA